MMNPGYIENNEMVILYNRNFFNHLQVLAYAKASGKAVSSYEIHLLTMPVDEFVFLVEQLLKGKVTDLVDQTNPYYRKKLKGSEFSVSEWYYILKNNPDLLFRTLVYFRGRSIIASGYPDIDRLFREK